ncbi:MAG: DUF29 domain-containing protein [Pseudomonadota bacterium]|nr:DUF29 domain-containing protein [Pseudomonadota bacterium]
MSTANNLYDRDFYAWAMRNAELIRQGRFAEVDLNNVAEELESMGRSERHQLENRLAVLLAHLLKWRFQPERLQRHGKSWRATIKEQRLRVKKRLAASPSLRHGIEDSFAEAYRYAVLRVVKETPLEEAALPAQCPFTLEQTLDENFWPEQT